MSRYSRGYAFCGCFTTLNNGMRSYLPQVALESHTTILATTSRTTLRQRFSNPRSETLKEVRYTFPLYDGVSVGGFKCTVGDRVVVGVVKERNTARADYDAAVAKGQTAGLFEQSFDAGDVFTTTIGNVPANQNVVVEITYLAELMKDAETDGTRFTIPTQIAPRYGSQTLTHETAPTASADRCIKIIVDIELEQGVSVRGIQSSSHPIAVTMGRTSTMMDDDDTFENHLGSSTLTLGSTELDKDFIIVVHTQGQDTPRALLERHPTLPNQRAIMTTLVPKFNLPNEQPEIVFVVDRSGSMGGKMNLVVDALKVFLKSLPIGIKFNIRSFGSRHSFLFDKSRTYDESSLWAAMNHIEPRKFQANYGGTEMLSAVQDVLQRRYEDIPLEVMLLTDGEIWNQEALFTEINRAQDARFFTLGIGSAASSSLVEGVARAGRAFAQWVNDGERIDKRIVRMLKAALTPHVRYQLEVKYRTDSNKSDDFEIIESFEKSMQTVLQEVASAGTTDLASKENKVISLFDTSAQDEPTNPRAGRYDHLPKVKVPDILQTPHHIPELYPHSRTTIYLLFGPQSPDDVPESIILRGQSKHGELRLEIPIQQVSNGTTLHQLAAKKAIQELEEGRGWLTCVQATDGQSLKSKHESQWDLMVEQEAVRLGTTFRVGGKFCSFIAVEENANESETHSDACDLEDYQMGLMMLEQQNKSRKRMASGNMMAHQSATGPSRSALVSSNLAPSAISYNYGFDVRSFHPAGLSHFQVSSHPFVQAVSLRPPEVAIDEVTLAQYAREMQEAACMPLPDGDDLTTVANHSQNGPQMSMMQAAPSTADPFRSSSWQGQALAAVVPQVSTSPALTYRFIVTSVHVQPAPELAMSAPAFGHETFDLDFSTLNNANVFQNFNLNTFLHASSEDSFAFNACDDLGSVFDTDSFSQTRGISFRNSGNSAGMARQRRASSVTHDDEFLYSIAHTGSASVRSQIVQLSLLEKMQRLLNAQTFSGSWPATEEVIAVVSHVSKTDFETEHEMVTAAQTACKDSVPAAVLHIGDSGVCATALSIAWLEKAMTDEKDVWEMVVEKAKGWLEGKLGSDILLALIAALKTMYKD